MESAIAIYSTYVSRNAPQRVPLDNDTVGNVELALSPEDGCVRADCFHEAAREIFEVLEKHYFPLFRKSDIYHKYCAMVLNSPDLRVEDIILSESAFPHFMEYMDREGAAILLRFWVAVDSFRKQIMSGLDLEEARKDAMGIYNKYFSLQASDPLGVDEKTRIDIENNICAVGGLNEMCFAPAQRIVYTALQYHYFPQFKQSDVFSTYCQGDF